VKTVLKLLGVSLSAIGLGSFIFGLFGLLDPQGSQLANDADPFGSPPPVWQFILQMGLSVAIFFAGAWLSFRKYRG
jgi:hypothetical protein